MDRDIHRRNVERLERVLRTAADESERKFILKLIEEERAKLNNFAAVQRTAATQAGYFTINGRSLRGPNSNDLVLCPTSRTYKWCGLGV